ncbi:Gamma-glutamylputrescine oxidoreductase [Vibrio aerogenes CECT 7868]|uniref:Gamma-glutamylputrescine oxidoreductase n=1 Tax=Vibrio aerogenes CECT 7868 TaxID=1216006 RepID=A0A1M6D5S7_9VIBR|nr:FAD-binding oxidoreductase [Vibrio aerogenes]SHI68464.1 Gamma-glutamylputrescine oxidoreductase [Vibrio aerogenes CECT 7868]
MINQSYWIDTKPRFTRGAETLGNSHYDVAIVGGGLTGLTAAHTLAKQGVSVALFEATAIMEQASGQNGGQCSTGVAQDFSALSATLGLDKAKRYYTAYSNAVDALRNIITEEQIECEFRESGKLKLAAKPQHAEKIFNTCELIQREVDPNVRFLDAEGLKTEITSGQFYGGMVQDNAFQIHVGKLGVGIADKAAEYGAHIYENSPVVQLKKQGKQFSVETPKGKITANDVIIASGISQHGPLGWFRRRIVPVGSFILVTEKLDPALIERLMPNKRSYVTSKIIGNYFRVMGDDRLLFGGRARFAMTSPESDAISGRILLKTMGEMFPELQGVQATHCWGGLVDITPNRLPRAGQHNGMFYAMGYSGHGVQMAAYMGQQLAHMLGGHPEANPWKDESWYAIPGYFGKPWFLPAVGAYYKLQDYLH